MKFVFICTLSYSVLLLLNILNVNASNCEENVMFGQMIQVINGNQMLTQHVLNLTDKINGMEMRLIKYAESFKKIEQSLRSYKVRRNNGKNEESSVNNDWIVIQRRKDGTENFYRSWDDYKNGFGEKEGEFFIGLEKLHKLTNNGKPMELLIVMEDFEGDRRYAKYDNFVVGEEADKYKLEELGDYSGTAGDSLSYHLGQKWSTKDQENDVNPKEHCAVWYTGAWWYNACHRSNLNGRYLKGEIGQDQHAQGIHWNSFRGLYYSLKFVEMKIRNREDDNKSDEKY